MLLLWSSGLTVGAAVCFILVVTGLVPNRLEPPEAGAVFPKVAARGAQSADTAVGAPEFQVIHEPADVISADLTASADSNDWNQNDALENIPAWDAQTVVSKPELPGGTLPGGALSATGPALSPQPIPSPQPAVADSSEAAAIGAAPDWPPIPVEKNPSDIYLGAAENPAPRSNAPGVPDVSGTAPASGTVPASGTAPEVSDWNQLAAASVSAPKTDLGENAPMKNQINRFDTTAAEVAASEDFYRQAYRQGESTVSGTAVRAQPSSPDPNASPADTPNISANAISTNTVTSAAPVQTVAGGNNFAGYQIRSTQAATAMQPPASGQLR